jgi:plasmid stabilization system protein ParE
MKHHKRSIAWSPEARADMASIWDYYAKVAGTSVANTIVREIIAASGPIEEHIFVGRLRNEIRPDLRSLIARQYIIFYRLRKETPEIVRVLDSRRDIDEVFADD